MRLGAGFVPLVGSLLSLADSLLIFRDSRQTLHDQMAGTFVVTGALVPGGAGFKPSAGVGAGGGVIVAVVGGLGALAVIGILAAIAIPNFVAMQLKAERSEVPSNVEAIRTAERAYHASFGSYLPVGSAVEADSELSGKTLHPWPGGAEWRNLGWAPDGMVRGAYWVEVVDGGFIVHGICDVDADGEYAHYTASEADNAQMRSPPETY